MTKTKKPILKIGKAARCVYCTGFLFQADSSVNGRIGTKCKNCKRFVLVELKDGRQTNCTEVVGTE